MNDLNNTLRDLLISSRNKSGYNQEDVSKELLIPLEKIKIWEELPIKIPLCEFPKILNAYKVSELAFMRCIMSSHIYLRKQ